MTMLTQIRQSRFSRRIVWSVFALFALRAIVPIGYMPASIADGGPFALCHGKSAATLALFVAHDTAQGAGQIHGAGEAHGSADSHGQDATQHETDDPFSDPASGHDQRWEECELGIGSAGAAMAPVMPSVLVAPAAVPVDSIEATLPARFRATLYRARAPPV